MRTNLPKISIGKLSLYISEWFLLSDGSESWVETPVVLLVWHCLFFSMCGLSIFSFATSYLSLVLPSELL